MSDDKLKLELEYLLQLQRAMERAGFTTEHAARLLDPCFLCLVREALEGIREIVEIDLIIKTDLDPCSVHGLEKCRHNRSLKPWVWNPTEFELYQSEIQESGKRVLVRKLIKWIRDRHAANACILDWARRHPRYLPISWLEWLRGNKNRNIWFPGTTYRDENMFERVRGLYLLDDRLSSRSRKLTESFGPDDVVVLMIV
jgi:hypothetical protein